MNQYLGHPTQLGGVEEVILAKGKGKGMNILRVRNTKNLELNLVADRAMDISRLFYKGINLGYFGPSGYVAPGLFDDSKGNGFLRDFYAGFLTTCGLTAAGSPCEDDGEQTPLHGVIHHTPCEEYYHRETESEIIVEAVVREAGLFLHQMELKRTYTISKTQNTIKISDTVTNIGNKPSPCMLLYHFNMGYPLLSETAEITIPEISSRARNEHAQTGYETRKTVESPQADYEEQCFYYDVEETNGKARVSIQNKEIGVCLTMAFDKKELPCFTQWKMMGVNDYVMGLEPGNCFPDGRDVMRRDGLLRILNPGEVYHTTVELSITDC